MKQRAVLQTEIRRFGKEAPALFLHFFGWLSENRLLAVLTGILTVLMHGALLLHSGDVLTDTETYIIQPENTMDTFVLVGRFGLVLTKKLFGTDGYTPFLFAAYTLLMLWLLCLCFDFAFSELMEAGRNKRSCRNRAEQRGRPGLKLFGFYLLFNLFYLSSPVLVHQYYFIYQSFEVTFAFFLCLFAVVCAFQAAWFGRSAFWYVPSLLSMVWAFATYQVLVPYYIALNAAFFVAAWLYGKPKSTRELLFVCGKLVGLFLLGLCGYFLSVRIVLMALYGNRGISYLFSNYLVWGRAPLKDSLNWILGDVRRVLFPELPAFNRFMCLLFPLSLLLLFANGRRAAKTAGKAGYWLYVLAVLWTPLSMFLMSFFLGNYQILRAHLVYPLVCAFLCGAFALVPYKKRILSLALTVFLFFAATEQMTNTGRYYTAMHLTAVEDEALAREIYAETQKYRDPEHPEEMPVIFSGWKSQTPLRVNSLRWDAMGLSFFEIDHGTLSASERISRFMTAIGLPTADPTEDDFQKGKKIAADMPVWPLEGSVRYQDGVIVVKLSEEPKMETQS